MFHVLKKFVGKRVGLHLTSGGYYSGKVEPFKDASTATVWISGYYGKDVEIRLDHIIAVTHPDA